ncbi:MAG: TolC family protein [Treponema sp.]|nr:TolC family protein [Treponema sp.]
MIKQIRPHGPPAGVLALALVMLIGGTALAQAPAATGQGASAPLKLSADEAVSLAIKNNLTLENSRVTVDTKKRKSDLFWNQFLPTIGVSGTLAVDDKKSKTTINNPVDLASLGLPIPSGQIYGIAPYSMDVSQSHILGSISGSLTISFALFEGIRSFKLDYQAGLLSYETVRASTERDVRKAYNQILLLEEQINLLHESYTMVERQVAMAEANYNSGLAPQLTLLQAQVSLANLQPQIDQAEDGYKMAMANFAFTLGLPVETRFELIPLADEVLYINLDTSDLISKTASGNPDIQETRAKILYANSGQKAQALQLYTPYLDLRYSPSATFIMDPWKDDWGNGDYWQKSGTFSLTVGLSLNNLLPFTKEGQGLKDTKNGVKAANIGLAQLIRGTEMQVYNTIYTLERTRTTADAQAATVRLAEQSYQLTSQAYQAGLQDYLQVQSAEQSLHQARVQMLGQQFDYRNGLIDLEYFIGVPFGTLSSN